MTTYSGALRSIMALLFVALTAAAAQAADFTENPDAGSTLSTAASLDVTLPTTTIFGSLGSASDVDIFKLTVNTAGAYSASTLGSNLDTQLFLFDSAGNGLFANDDDASGTHTSFINGNLTAGTFYMAVTAFDNDPVTSGGSLIFPNINEGIVAGSGVLAGFNGNGFGKGGDYAVALSGTGIENPIPEPSAMALLGLGLGISALRRRRKQA